MEVNLEHTGPKSPQCRTSIFSHLLKTKISKDNLVELKNKWLKDGVPGSSIAEEEDDDNEEEEDRKYGDSDGGSQMEG